MLVNGLKMLARAKKEQYAIPQFNLNNLEWTRYILEECERLKSPVILGVSEGAVNYMGGYQTVANLVCGLIKDLGITIPVVLHLDHGSSVENCFKAINSGFTSVMIDASLRPITENIKMTKEVTAYANKYGVMVEAEVGQIGGTEDNINGENLYATVEACRELVVATKVDTLAPALGSVHGLYQGEPKLNFKRMKEIAEEVKIPLVLHGGTGIPNQQIKKAILLGTTKININTELQVAWASAVRSYLEQDHKVYDPRQIIGAGANDLKQVVASKVKLFGSLNKV